MAGGNTWVGPMPDDRNFRPKLSLIVLSALVASILVVALPFDTRAHKISEHGDILLGGLFPIHQKGKLIIVIYPLICYDH